MYMHIFYMYIYMCGMYTHLSIYAHIYLYMYMYMYMYIYILYIVYTDKICVHIHKYMGMYRCIYIYYIGKLFHYTSVAWLWGRQGFGSASVWPGEAEGPVHRGVGAELGLQHPVHALERRCCI